MSDTNNTNSKGRFGRYGGQYVPETLMNAMNWRKHTITIRMIRNLIRN